MISLALYSAAAKAGEERVDAVVAGDGSGQYRNVQDAINAAPSKERLKPWTIMVKPGYYHERVCVTRENGSLRLIGEDPLRTTIGYDLTATVPGVDGRPIGMLSTASVFIAGDDFSAENISFINSAGPNGPAVAVRIAGDRITFRNCRFLGWQDTLLLERGRHYFEDCFIAGQTDFILGGATAWFERCRLHCWRDGFITAASTPADTAAGFVFARCRVTGESSEVRSFLGRPWRDHAAVTFLETQMSAVVRPEGWGNWNSKEREKTARIFEYKNTGHGAERAGRAPWSHSLAPGQAANLTPARVFSGVDPWIPAMHDGVPSADISASDRTDPFRIPGFTIEGVLAMLRSTHPQASKIADVLPNGVISQENITYAHADGQELQLDIYRPERSGSLPAILLIHGGGWVAGDRIMERPLAKEMASRGYVTVPVSYRLGIAGRFPGSVHDLKAAVRWLRIHASEYGIDPNRIGVMGGSAGGALAALLGASNGHTEIEGSVGETGRSSAVQAVVCLDGAATFLDNALIASAEKNPTRFWVFVGGRYRDNPEMWRGASALEYVGPQSAPCLFLNSSSPLPILPGREAMAARLRIYGIESQIICYEGAPHPFWLVHPWFEKVLDAADEFFRANMPAK